MENEIKELLSYMKEQKEVLKKLYKERIDLKNEKDKIDDKESGFYQDAETDYNNKVEEYDSLVNKVKEEIKEKKKNIIENLEKDKKIIDKYRKDYKSEHIETTLLSEQIRKKREELEGARAQLKWLKATVSPNSDTIKQAEDKVIKLENEFNESIRTINLIPEDKTAKQVYIELQDKIKNVDALNMNNLEEIAPNLTETTKTEPEETKTKENEQEENEQEEIEQKENEQEETEQEENEQEEPEQEENEQEETEQKENEQEETEQKENEQEEPEQKENEQEKTDEEEFEDINKYSDNKKQEIYAINIDFAREKFSILNDDGKEILNEEYLDGMDDEELEKYNEKSSILIKQCIEELKEEYSDIDIDFAKEKADPMIISGLAYIDRKEEIKEYIKSLWDKEESIPFFLNYDMRNIYDSGLDRDEIKYYNKIAKFAKKQNRAAVQVEKDNIIKRAWGNLKLRASEWKENRQLRIAAKKQEALPAWEKEYNTVDKMEEELNREAKTDNKDYDYDFDFIIEDLNSSENNQEQEKTSNKKTSFVQTYSQKCMEVLASKTTQEIQEKIIAAGGMDAFELEELMAIIDRQHELNEKETRQQETETKGKEAPKVENEIEEELPF